MPLRPKAFRPKPVTRQQEARPSSNARGYSYSWQRTRLAYLTAHPICQIAGPACTHAASEVDHRIPLNSGGSRLDWNNLRSACSTCHKQVTANYRVTGRNELPRSLPLGGWAGQ